MSERGEDPLAREARSDWLRLRTLVMLRWLAIGGQGAAVLAARFVFGLDIDLWPALMAIGALVAVNLFAVTAFPRNYRLSEGSALAMLMIDVVQLMVLIALTGGLTNPFAVLVLAPVTIAATTLGPRSIALMNSLAIGLVTAVALAHRPLVTLEGTVLDTPDLLLKGIWFALVVAVLFVSVYTRRVTLETHAMQQALAATQLALGREQQLTALGGVVAAAAHELGTPLATIKLASAELADELDDRPDLRADAELIRAQADRCRDILREMGRAGKQDVMLRQAPVGALVREAAEPHAKRGRKLDVTARALFGDDSDEPVLPRRPELVHGLRNVIENAVDHARSSVTIDIEWSAAMLRVRVADDGPGFPPELIARIGEPFLGPRSDRTAGSERSGMGLGLFIAKTLLERTGAELSVANRARATAGKEPGGVRGAVVEVTWPRDRIAIEPAASRAALGRNPPVLP